MIKKLSLNIIPFFVMLLTISCASTPIICQTPTDCVKEGVRYHNMDDSEIALKYFKKAIKSDSNYQPAYVWSGIIYVIKGESVKASKYFERAVTIAPNTAEAETAQAWLKRLKEPLAITVLKFESASRQRGSRIGQQASDVLSNKLFESEVFRVIPSRDIGGIRRRTTDLYKICSAAKEAGIKIVITGVIQTLNVSKYNAGTFALGPILIQTTQRTERRYKVYGAITIKVYSTKNTRLLKSISKSCERKGFSDKNEGVSKILNCISQKITKEIHKVLM